MTLDKTNTTRFANDKEQSERSAREQLKFILANQSALLKVMNGRKYLMSAEQMSESKEPLTDKQKSYVDVIYERVMKGLGLPSYSGSFKPKKKYI